MKGSTATLFPDPYFIECWWACSVFFSMNLSPEYPTCHSFTIYLPRSMENEVTVQMFVRLFLPFIEHVTVLFLTREAGTFSGSTSRTHACS